MQPIILNAKDLNLPKKIARKIKGKKVAIIETNEGFLIKTKFSSITSSRGILKGKGPTTEEFAKMKAEEKELER
jgi:hypothetical protein